LFAGFAVESIPTGNILPWLGSPSPVIINAETEKIVIIPIKYSIFNCLYCLSGDVADVCLVIQQIPHHSPKSIRQKTGKTATIHSEGFAVTLSSKFKQWNLIPSMP
jgi:hypothetical protein